MDPHIEELYQRNHYNAYQTFIILMGNCNIDPILSKLSGQTIKLDKIDSLYYRLNPKKLEEFNITILNSDLILVKRINSPNVKFLTGKIEDVIASETITNLIKYKIELTEYEQNNCEIILGYQDLSDEILKLIKPIKNLIIGMLQAKRFIQIKLLADAIDMNQTWSIDGIGTEDYDELKKINIIWFTRKITTAIKYPDLYLYMDQNKVTNLLEAIDDEGYNLKIMYNSSFEFTDSYNRKYRTKITFEMFDEE